MKTIILAVLGVAGSLVLLGGAAVGFLDAKPPASREKLEELFRQGNYKDAYDGYRALALDPKDDPGRVGQDLRNAIQCLVQLGRLDEIDDFREAVIQIHKGNWRLIQSAAESYMNDGNHQGFIVAGKFHRGHQGDGRFVNAFERDRSCALQLLAQGLDRVRSDPDRPGAARYFFTLGQALLMLRAEVGSWRLQSQTPLETLPDYDDFTPGLWGVQATGAPVGVDGQPVYYQVPQDFAKARSDGERWRWALAQAVEADAGQLNAARYELASFLLSQFGTQTLAGVGLPGPSEDGRPAESGTWALNKLRDEETIARLATGVKRFTLPDEFNPIKIYQRIADDPQTGHGEDALSQLSSIFENRRQLDRAAEYLKRSKDSYGDQNGWKAQQLGQILGAWGQFEPGMTQPAGRGATVDFQFRNGRRVQFEAHEVLFNKLLGDVKEYLSSRPPQLNWQQIDINDVGSRLVALNQQQYQGRLVARWELDLEPPQGHLDRRITVNTPLQKAGAYLLTARMDGGNTCHIVVWLDDTVIVKKLLQQKIYYFIADSRTGQPVPGADVDLFGWRMLQVEGKNEFHMETKALSLKSDQEGQVVVPTDGLHDAKGVFQWLCTADPRGPPGPSRIRSHMGTPVLRPRLRSGQGDRDHGPSGLSSRPAGAVQVLGGPCPLRSARRLGFRPQDLHGRDPESQG